jgi:protein-disulfide isomerase
MGVPHLPGAAHLRSSGTCTLEENMRFPLYPSSACALVVLLLASVVTAQQTTPVDRSRAVPPKFDKQAVEKYLRYAEGYAAQVEIAVDDPTPSPIPGFNELHVHLKAGTNEAVRIYYVTPNAEQIVSGALYDLRKSPFATNLPKLKEEGAPATGPENAAVKVYVFSDFECPYCREEAKILRETVEKQHPNDLRIIFKDYPLEAIHQWAKPAAIAGRCIARQNNTVFWGFHDYMYEHQQEIGPNNLRDKVLEFAKGQSLDVLQLSSCMDTNATAGDVDRTVAEGRDLGISQTPTMFANGRPVTGALPAQQWDALINLELQRQKQQTELQKSGEKCCEVNIPAIGTK